jgi:hypothetical protein
MTNDEGSSNAPAFAKASPWQANDETGVMLSRRDSDFVIPSSFDVRHLSFLGSVLPRPSKTRN